MTEHKKKKLKRLIFPIGIFLLVFIVESVIGTIGVISYFYYSGKERLLNIESYTMNYSKTMAEAFTKVAEFSYSTKKYSGLKSLFHEKIEQNTIDEAFFVFSNGKLIVHSSTTTEKELKGNIASDEIAYNLDMILLPVQMKSTDLILNNYNIINKTVPFIRRDRELLKKYIYPDINSTGWLFTKAVYFKGKPVGTVNFIISKDRLYDSIKDTINQAKHYTFFVIAVSAILSFIVSLIVWFRYRSIQRNALDSLDFAMPVYVSELRPEKDETADSHISAIDNHETDDISFFPPDSNRIDTVMDFVVEDDLDIKIIDEDTAFDSISESVKDKPGSTIVPLRRHEFSTDNEESITVELLGEIDHVSEQEIPAERTKIVREYIAPVISLDDYKKSLNIEIRDAIPLRKRGK